MDKDSQNYYDVLNVRRDCSGKEIRSAFLELSKKVEYTNSKNM